jgi:hypothetical protein
MKPWHKIATKTEWDKACVDACAAARVEVPEALRKQREEKLLSDMESFATAAERPKKGKK